jgi:hypothetical protein
MNETPVTPGDISRGPKLRNSLEARSKEAAGRGTATKVGRVFKGLVKALEERWESGVSSAIEAGDEGGALGVGPVPGGPGGLKGTGRGRGGGEGEGEGHVSVESHDKRKAS